MEKDNFEQVQEKYTVKNKVGIGIAEVEQDRQLHKTTCIANENKTRSLSESTRQWKQTVHRTR